MQNQSVLFVNARFLTQEISGVQRYAFACSLQMKQLCPYVQFLTPSGIRHTEWAEMLEVQILPGGQGYYWEQITLPRFLRKQPGARLINFANTAPLWQVCSYALTLHDTLWLSHKVHTLPFRWIYQFCMPLWVSRANVLMTISETVRQDIIKRWSISPDKIILTPNIPWLPKPRLGTTLPREPVILSVGSPAIHKGWSQLIHAFLESGLSSAYRLVLVGETSGVHRHYKQIRHPSILYTGRISDEALCDWYRRAQLYVSFSTSEGFGLPVLEALFAGCPVLCNDMAVYRELFEGWVTFCPVSDQEKCIGSLKEAIRNPIKAPDPEVLKRRFNLESAMRQLIKRMSQ